MTELGLNLPYPTIITTLLISTTRFENKKDDIEGVNDPGHVKSTIVCEPRGRNHAVKPKINATIVRCIERMSSELAFIPEMSKPAMLA